MPQWLTQFPLRKVSTPEEFDALVAKIEAFAQRNPTYYRRRLQLLACLGYVYIFAIFILLFVGLWGIRQYLISIQNQEMIESLNRVVYLVGFGLISLFFIHFEPPKGIPLTRKQAPQFFDMIDELSSNLKAPRLDNVILNEELNAAIVQRPKYGFIGWHTNYLVIGLPLLQVLSPQQCKAVIAHELAHLCGGDGRASAWIYRIRLTWYELAERFEHIRRGGFLFQRFFSWYGPFFRAYSFVHARSQEYDADRRAANIAGASHKAEALIWLYVNSMLLHEQYWSNYLRRTINLKEPAEDSISQILQILKAGMTSEQSRVWLSLCLAKQTDNSSTHPCLAERLNALNYTIPEVLDIPKTYATNLLGDQFVNLTGQLNQYWKEEASEDWADYYDCNQHQLSRLDSLNNRPEQLLTIEERIKRAAATWHLQERQAAFPMFQSIINEAPKHAVARYWVGYILTEELHDQGVAHLNFAIDQDPSLVIPACRQLYVYYLKQNQPTLAETYKQRWQKHEKVWSKAVTERSKFTQKTQFKPHELPNVEVRQLVEQLSSYPEVKTVYLAQKVVEHFPEYPYYVFGIARRNRYNMNQDYRSNRQLECLIKSTIAFSQDYSLHFFNELEYWQRFKKVKDAKIYFHQ